MMERAMSGSTSRGDATTRSKVPSTSEMLWAMVNDETMSTSSRRVRTAITSETTNSTWSRPPRMCITPLATKPGRLAAGRVLVLAGVSPS